LHSKCHRREPSQVPAPGPRNLVPVPDAGGANINEDLVRRSGLGASRSRTPTAAEKAVIPAPLTLRRLSGPEKRFAITISRMVNHPSSKPDGSDGPGGGEPSISSILDSIQEHLRQLERLAGPDVAAVRSAPRHIEPAWQRVTQGEQRLPVAIAVCVAIALQMLLPNHLVIHPSWLLPALEGALLVGLIAANPRRISRTSTTLRTASVALIALISVANAWSTAELVIGLINGTEGENAGVILARGASIYITNIIVFSLWYWEWDRGGPVARATAPRPYTDFLFPQMTQPHLTSPDWEPTYIDYLYLSFTNATAFSPTDVMPLARWAKILMLVQAAVALLTLAMVIARAVNIFK
jgi:uncharacterized membrane protein